MELRQLATAELRFRACGRDVIASVCPAWLADDVRRLFRDYAMATGSASSREAQLTVGLHASGYAVRWNGRQEESEKWIDALSSVEAALAELLLGSCAEHLQLHAGGCVVDGQALVVIGGPGAGKSSLTAAWAASGVPVLGDDVVLLNAAGQFLPFKRPIKVAAPLLPVIGVDPATTLFWSPDAEEAWLDPALGGGWAHAAPAAVIALVRYEAGATWRVRDAGRAELLSALLYGLFPTGRPARRGFATLADAVGRCRTVEARFGSVLEAAEALTALLA